MCKNESFEIECSHNGFMHNQIQYKFNNYTMLYTIVWILKVYE